MYSTSSTNTHSLTQSIKGIVIENYEYDQIFDVDDKYEDEEKLNMDDDDDDCEQDDGDKKTVVVVSGKLYDADRQRIEISHRERCKLSDTA